MTDQEIDDIAKPFGSFCVASGSREFDHVGFARALFARAAQNIMTNEKVDDIAAEVFGTMATHQERKLAHELLSRAIPEGHVVVPKEPTGKMLQAVFEEIGPSESGEIFGYAAYAAMIAAAPTNKEGT